MSSKLKIRCVIFFLLSCFFLAAGSQAGAETIIVNNFTDEISDSDGCSLREAIINANDDAATCADCLAGTGTDIIVFDSGINGTPIELTLVGDDDIAEVGDLDITGPLTISGNGQSQTIIQGGPSEGNGIDRVFHVHPFDDNVTFSHLTIRYGRSDDIGGGIRIDNIYANNNDSATFDTCAIVYNESGNSGGGVYSYSQLLTITDSILSHNTAEGFGGGIELQQSDVALVIENSTISDNSAGLNGGGIRFGPTDGFMTLTGCTISDNEAALDGGGLRTGGSGITWTITNCTISGNTALGGTQNDSDGGGFDFNSYRGIATIINSTIVGNSAVDNGGGIFCEEEATVNLSNTIVAMNTVTEGGGPNLSGDFVSQDYNLIGDAAGYTFSGSEINNIITPDPVIGPLAQNGGPTMTHALLDGSPAIDQGNCNGGTVNVDQRGAFRPQGDGCDIGAFEVGSLSLSIPTLSEWGMIILMALLGYISVYRMGRTRNSIAES